MRDPSLWRPTRLVRNKRTGAFDLDLKAIWSGSHYIAGLQHSVYVPIIREHITGHVLDCGCGRVPFHELYSERCDRSTCIDRSTDPMVSGLLDAVVDLNGPLPFPDAHFDSVLLTDVIAHVREPRALMNELARVLRPGGRLVLTTPFIYWLCEYPHDYYHPSQFALEDLCHHAGFEVEQLISYGGQADVLMDTLNKMMATGLRHRIFTVLSRLLVRTGWLGRDRERTRQTYSLGYCLVAVKS